eukprot:CAMPEP_0170172626 /NCGR_PEP_ID=MMETSP0040_2-20121228/5882_1 /TAXON_ID=641309 /ORGANISM="Lotharella oceanica, Strain CCMP622" /LENGTH=116 /DNA_ID=CAMNT_0010413383 /DNA_START=833 /DNA_END=1183 /DNA_ORIENTATION=-
MAFEIPDVFQCLDVFLRLPAPVFLATLAIRKLPCTAVPTFAVGVYAREEVGIAAGCLELPDLTWVAVEPDAVNLIGFLLEVDDVYLVLFLKAMCPHNEVVAVFLAEPGCHAPGLKL